MKRFLDNSLELGREITLQSLEKKAWKKESSPKLGKERALERLEVKKGRHHIPNH
jgi:hypothetical protein